MTTESWEKIAKSKRDALNALIPEAWKITNPPSIEDQVDVTQYIETFLDQEERDITGYSADQIAHKVATGSLTATKVTQAFCHRAALAHQLLHCLHEIFFDAAIEDAKKLDAEFEKTGKTTGPLHGVPVSLKDQFHVKDVETTMGYVGWIGTFEGKKGTGKEKVFESEMVTMLRKAGAVLYCKTSVPHTLMTGETVNNIIGYTLNPKNRHLSSGGSSGGEGALIGARGSPLGLGTDIGGSIRIPAGFNGLYGLRPSTGRLPYQGMANSMDGQNTVISVVGPLATNAASLKLLTKTILAQQPWLEDPFVHEIPWRAEKEEVIRDQKLRFAVIKTDGIVTPHPPVTRAVDILVKKLQDAGHEVVPWDGPSHDALVKAGSNSWIYDAGKDIKDAFALSGEPISNQVILFDTLEKEFSATEIAATNVRVRELRKEYLDWWNRTAEKSDTGRPIDGIIMPLAPFAAALPERYTYVGYTTWVNVLDYTTVVVPVTNVDKAIDGRIKDYKPLNNQDRNIQADYDPEIYHGAHVSLQIVGRRLEEEKMIGIAEHIEELMKGKA